MVHNTNKLAPWMGDYINFQWEWFFRCLGDPNNKNIEYSLDVYKQFLLVQGEINDASEELDPKKLDSDWQSCNFLKNYIKDTECSNKDLNDLLIKMFCLDNNKYMTFTETGKKKLMREVIITNEFYLEHVDKLGKFYNILKRKNPELKEDGVKLVTTIEKQTTTLEDEIDTKYNLSSKKIFELDPKYFVTHYHHFNWDAIKVKYWDELKEITKKMVESDVFSQLDDTNNHYINYFLEEVISHIYSQQECTDIKVDICCRNLKNYSTMREFFKGIELMFNIPDSVERRSGYFWGKLRPKIEEKLDLNFSDKCFEDFTFTSWYRNSFRNQSEELFNQYLNEHGSEMLFTKENFEKIAKSRGW